MGAPDWVDAFPIENGDISASYVSLPVYQTVYSKNVLDVLKTPQLQVSWLNAEVRKHTWMICLTVAIFTLFDFARVSSVRTNPSEMMPHKEMCNVFFPANRFSKLPSRIANQPT